MTQVNTSNWDLRNMWVNPSGELTTRPGADLLRDVNVDPSIPRGGFSVKSQYTDTVQHYVFLGYDGNLELHILDENLNNVRKKQIITLGIDRPIGPVSYAAINGEMIVSGPDIPTLWGYTGSGLVLAEKQDTVDVSLETLSVPNGLCVAWASHFAVAVGDQILVSDGLAPRTYTAGGIIYLAGLVYGLHVSSNGDLVAVTTNGVFALSAQAVVQGGGVSGAVQQLSSYQAVGYNKSVMTPNGLYGLTERGYRRIDVEEAQEVSISDKSYVRSLTDMISFPDYRVGKMWETNTGFAVTIGNMDEDDDDKYSGGICMVDLYKNIRSWWTVEGIGRVRGMMKEREGDDLFLMSRHSTMQTYSSVWRFHTDKDYNHTVSDYYEGSMSGLVNAPSEMWPVVRAIFIGADNGGHLVKVAVRGEYIKKNGSLQEIVTSSGDGVVVGEVGNDKDDWSPSLPATGAKRLKTAELEANRFQFSKRTNDASIEFAVSGGKIRVGSVDIRKAGYGQRRPT